MMLYDLRVAESINLQQYSGTKILVLPKTQLNGCVCFGLIFEGYCYIAWNKEDNAGMEQVIYLKSSKK